MNGIQNRKAQDIEKAFPGCLGRMVNFFDLSNGVNANRLLSDKPHIDASLSRSRSDVTRMRSAPLVDQIEDKMIVSELTKSSSNKKINGTPIKALIAEEMSKEVDSRDCPPNLVAKLMGLDALPPHQQHNSAAKESWSKGYSSRSLSHSGVLGECWEQDQNCLDKQVQCEERRHLQGQIECKDVYEIWQQSQRINSRYSSPKKERQSGNANEKKMAIIRQKFEELKRLATDEKGRQSQEFQEALEVISSNRDLFVKFLQEPNSMFSQRLYDMQYFPASPETKHITVLRPSRVVDDESLSISGKKVDKQAKKPVQINLAKAWDKNDLAHFPIYASQGIDEHPAQPTRIVVLKPSRANAFDMKAANSPASSPRILRGEELFYEPDNVEAQESREVAEEITRHMRENLMGHRRDETLMSSVFSNGYVGDDSSFNKSENEYEVGNLSDSEIMSPTSKHSWDYVNRLDSPYSCSSFSRASCSPESSVCREAKKRLSERWALMSLNGSSQEQKTARRSSSTLGEMLSLSDAKKPMSTEIESIKEEQESRGSTSCLGNNLTNKEDTMDDSPKSLSRSKSLPVSSTVYVSGFNGEASNREACKPEVSKELTKSKSTKSSFKEKVSSLFFSRNKKPSNDNLATSQSTDGSHFVTSEILASPALSRKNGDAKPQCINNTEHEGCSSLGSHGSMGKISYLDCLGSGAKQGFGFQEGGLSVSKRIMPGCGNTGESQDQPSPISVLEPVFEEDDINTREPSANLKLESWGSDKSIKSNLIDKSPPIGSIARTLSWDDSRADTAGSYSVKPSPISSVAPEEEEQDWFLFVQTLLSMAGLDGKTQVESDTFCDSWHSPESPLDPALRDKYANVDNKELLHEAKQRQRRSSRKLVFDCINAALVELARRNGSERTCGRDGKKLNEGAATTLEEYVWDQMKEWLCRNGESGDGNSAVVERVVMREVVGKGWVDNMKMEIDRVGMEIQGKLLEELVEEAVWS